MLPIDVSKSTNLAIYPNECSYLIRATPLAIQRAAGTGDHDHLENHQRAVIAILAVPHVAGEIPPNLFLSACDEKYNAANERHRAQDGRQRNIVSLLASGVNRSDVDDLFASRIRKPTPRETEQAKHDQNDAKRFAHGSPLRQRLH